MRKNVETAFHLNYSSRHQIACFKATEGNHTHTHTDPYRVALSHHYSVASFATVQVLNCLHSPQLHCSCCNVVRFWCDLEACNLVTATIVFKRNLVLLAIINSRPSVFAAGVQCKTSAFGDEPRRNLKVIQRFGKHSSCYFHCECVGWALFGSLPHIRPLKNAQPIYSPWRWQLQYLSKR
jgi:hypothetical protein